MSFTFTWYGHATLGLETGGQRILIDPFFTGNPAVTTPAEEVAADYILISHGHGDHVGDAEAIQKRTGATIVSNFEICEWLEARGAEVSAQHIGGAVQYPFGRVKLVPAIHGSGLPDGSYGGLAAGFLITTPEGENLYFAQDTALFGDMKLIGDEGITLAVLPIGDKYTMGPQDALRALALLRPQHAIPIHYSTWEPIRQDPQAFAEAAESRGLSKVHVLQPGGSFSLP